MNVAAAFPVDDAAQVAEPRRVVLWLASVLAFSEERAGRAALIVSEMATNLAKHARGGEILMRRLTAAGGESSGIEVVALDRGPGIDDAALSQRDGFSTAGTLGHGLGAMSRQADHFELYTQPSGTICLARIWRERLHAPVPEPQFDIGAIHVSKPGETICGDGWTWRMRDGRLVIFVADGLGHGLAAHDAAAAAVATFEGAHESAPARLMEDVHAALRPTRGAAIAVVALDLERRVAAFAGLGNITGVIVPAEGVRRNMVSHNGTAGHTAGRIQEFTYPVPAGSTLVLASDGLASHWNLNAYPGWRTRSASVIAALLYRDHSRRRDDVTVVVARERPAVAEKL